MKDFKFKGYDWWSLGLGLGLLPFAPGTFGSLLGIPLALFGAEMPFFWSLGWLLFWSVFSWVLCAWTFVKLGGVDHPAIVSDEVIGYMWAVYGFGADVVVYLLAFVLFRFFDIVKPWPIGWIDRKEFGVHSVMADDLVAGIVTNIILRVVVYFGWVLVVN